jgi:hypothetical protein
MPYNNTIEVDVKGSADQSFALSIASFAYSKYLVSLHTAHCERSLIIYA